MKEHIKKKCNQGNKFKKKKKKHDQKCKEHQQKNMTKATKPLIENITNKIT
jgi:hypothetical protein